MCTGLFDWRECAVRRIGYVFCMSMVYIALAKVKIAWMLSVGFSLVSSLSITIENWCNVALKSMPWD